MSNTAVQAWLRVALGEEVARDVMQLPAEVRKSLYGDVLRWGPAGNEIQAFFAAFQEQVASGDYSGDLEELFAPVSGISDWSLSFTADDGDEAVGYLLGVLGEAADDAGDSFWLVGRVEWCLTFIVVTLTSPWFPDSLSQFRKYAPQVNEVLGQLGLPLMRVVGAEFE